MSNSNPLLSPPFYVIPGIDPNSPISAQTEQIDQLNTLLLQEIDANFARLHQIVTSRILPEIKRFAIAGEPTREAAQFWRSFFEAASASRPHGTSTDTGLSTQQDISTQYDDNTITLRRDLDESGMIRDESGSSFIFDPPATSSTPLPSNRNGNVKMNESWEDSLESPFDKLDRKLRDELKIGNNNKDIGNNLYGNNTSSDLPTPSLPSGYSLPNLNKNNSSSSSMSSWNQSSLNQNRNQHQNSQDLEEYSTGTVDPNDLPSQFGYNNNRPSSATPKANNKSTTNYTSTTSNKSNNPFGPNFNGIVDLRSTPLNAKSSKTKRPPKQSILPGIDDIDSSDDEDNAGGLPFGMSPPVTMKFSLPPKAQAIFDISKTPGKKVASASREPEIGEAATRSGTDATTPGVRKNDFEGEKQAKAILDDLMSEMDSEVSPRMPTPDGLGRYSIMPGELQPGEGRLLFSSSSSANDQSQQQRPILEEEERDEETYHFNPSAYNSNNQERTTRRSIGANTSFGSDVVDLPVGQVYSAEDSFDNDLDDSFDIDDDNAISQPTNTGSIINTGIAGMVVGSGTGTISSVPYSSHENIINYDDSYLSSEGDLTTTSEAGHIFGKQPNYLPSQSNSQNQFNNNTLAGGVGAGPRKSQFELMKRDEMDTYFGGKLEDRAGHDVDSSPTKALADRGRGDHA